MQPLRPSDSLIPPVEDAPAVSRHSQRTRRGAMVVLTLFVLAGLFNLLGVRLTTSYAEAGGLEVEVLHASIGRAGLTAPLEVSVHRPGGIDGPVEVSVTSDYLDRLDQYSLDPQPDRTRAGARTTTWSWDHVDGDTHVLTIDARIEPGVHWRFDGVVEVAAGGDEARVEVVTWVAP